MYCPKCGWKNPDDATKCANCFAELKPGQPQPTQQMPSQPQPPQQPYAQQPPEQPYSKQPYAQQPYQPQYQQGWAQPVPDYLVWSILVTISCCMPFGVVAIVKSAAANSRKAAGDYYGALQEANAAKTWLMWGFGIGLAADVIWVLVLIIASVGGP